MTILSAATLKMAPKLKDHIYLIKVTQSNSFLYPITLLTPAIKAEAAKTAAFSVALLSKALRPSALHTTLAEARLQIRK